MDFYARPGQLLKDHLLSVANLCRQALSREADLAYVAGLLHDLGKYRADWQYYLQDKTNGKKFDFKNLKYHHAPHGALTILNLTNNRFHPLCYVIKGHHGNLPTTDNIDELSKKYDLATQEAIKNFQNELELPAIPTYVNRLSKLSEDDRLKNWLLIKMLFSALVDADRFDAFLMSQNQNNQPNNLEFIKQKIPLQLKRISLSNDSPLKALRNEFRDLTLQSISENIAMFRLTGPCGIGKTLGSLQFAVGHCNYHQMRGIIYVGPFISIIDQNTQQYRQALNLIPDQILEHHSSFSPTDDELENYKNDCERWDVPVICTSAVQFFQTLLTTSASQNRKLHQLQERVIIIDEAQTIPIEFSFVIKILDLLVKDYDCSVVLMSATQPCFTGLSYLSNIKFIDIIPPAKSDYFNQHLNNRCQLIYLPNHSLLKAYQEYQGDRHLVIVNTIKKSVEFFQQVNDGSWSYLSSRLCSQHRLDVLNNLKPNLVSTQIVEAGINIDFPICFSELALIDSIVQRMGRVGREWKDQGLFYICDPDQNLPYNFERMRISREIINDWPGINEAIMKYYQIIYDDSTDFLEKDLQNSKHYLQLLQNLKFNEINNWQIINDEYSASVLVPYQTGKDYIDQINSSEFISAQTWRQIQPFTAKIPKSWESQAILLNNGVRIWQNYDPILGCVL